MMASDCKMDLRNHRLPSACYVNHKRTCGSIITSIAVDVNKYSHQHHRKVLYLRNGSTGSPTKGMVFTFMEEDPEYFFQCHDHEMQNHDA